MNVRGRRWRGRSERLFVEDREPREIWAETFAEGKEQAYRFGIGDTLLEARLRDRGDDRCVLLLSPGSGRHFTILGHQDTGRFTIHETLEGAEHINAAPLLVLSRPHIDRVAAETQFTSWIRDKVLRSIQFLTRPRQLEAAGVVAVVPFPTDRDWKSVSSTRVVLQQSRFVPKPLEAPWNAPPGTAFMAIGTNYRQCGSIVTGSGLPSGQVAYLSLSQVVGVLTEAMHVLSEPQSPPPDFMRSFRLG